MKSFCRQSRQKFVEFQRGLLLIGKQKVKIKILFLKIIYAFISACLLQAKQNTGLYKNSRRGS